MTESSDEFDVRVVNVSEMAIMVLVPWDGNVDVHATIERSRVADILRDIAARFDEPPRPDCSGEQR